MYILGGHEYELEPKPPYNIKPFLDRLGYGPYPHTYRDCLWRRLIWIEDTYIPVDIHVGGDIWNPMLRVGIHTSEEELSERVYRELRNMFMVDLDYQDFIRKSRKYVSIYSLSIKRIGERPLGHYSSYEAYMEAAIINRPGLRHDYKRLKKFIMLFGVFIHKGGEWYWGYPRPSNIVDADMERLTSVLGSRMAAWTVKSIAEEGSKPNPDYAGGFGVGKSIEGLAKSRLYSLECGDREVERLRRFKSEVLMSGVSSRDYRDLFKGLRSYCGLILYLIESEYFK